MATLNEELSDIQGDIDKSFGRLADRLENLGRDLGEERERLIERLKAVENSEIRRLLASIASRLDALEQKLGEDDEE